MTDILSKCGVIPANVRSYLKAYELLSGCHIETITLFLNQECDV